MASVNKVILVGRLGKDPEVKYTQSGLAIGSASLATDGPPKNGEKGVTEWHRLVLFDKQAESLAKFKKKGDTIYVEGRIQTREWSDKNGEKRYVTEIVVSQVTFLGGGRNDGGDGDHGDNRGASRGGGHAQRSGGGRNQASQGSQGGWSDEPDSGGYSGGANASYPDDDDIPF